MKVHEITTTLAGGISPALPIALTDPSYAAVLSVDPTGQHECTARYDVRAFADKKLYVMAIDAAGNPCPYDNATVRVTILEGSAPAPIESPGPIASMCCSPSAERPGAQTTATQAPTPTPQVPSTTPPRTWRSVVPRTPRTPRTPQIPARTPTPQFPTPRTPAVPTTPPRSTVPTTPLVPQTPPRSTLTPTGTGATSVLCIPCQRRGFLTPALHGEHWCIGCRGLWQRTLRGAP